MRLLEILYYLLRCNYIIKIKDFCDYVILGHSERRKYFNEDDVLINKKVLLSLENNLKPIVCIGENLQEREKNLTEYKIKLQLEGCLKSISNEAISEIVIAYEPIWAIGTGISDNPEKANLIIKIIRKYISDVYTEEKAFNIRILYGGSINLDNSLNFIKQSEIDGFLIGNSSLDSDIFLRLLTWLK